MHQSKNIRFAKRLVVLAGLCGLGGCAMQEGDFPSLAKRPVEDIAVLHSNKGQVAPATPSVAEIAVRPAGGWSAAGQATITSLEELETQFSKAMVLAKAAIRNARGQSVGSERWAQAQLAISAVSRSQSATAEIMADLDRSLVELQVTGDAGNVGGEEELLALWRRTDSQLTSQQSQIDKFIYQ